MGGRRIWVPFISWVILAILLAIPLYRIQTRLEQFRGQVTADDSIKFLPSSRFLSTMVLGYDNLTADLLWVRGIALFGDKYQTTHDNEWYDWLFQLIDLASDMDPLDVRIYKYGGLMLRYSPFGIDRSTYVFHKGMQKINTEYFLPFGVAMNYLDIKKDPKRAAEYMKVASVAPNAPFYLRNLAASLLDQTRQQDAALTFLEEELKTLEPETLKYRAVRVKILEVKHDRSAHLLRVSLNAFLSIYNRAPDPLREMVGRTWFAPWPPDPFGAEYVIDRASGRVQSKVYLETMKRFGEETGLGSAGKSGTQKLQLGGQ